MTSACVYVRVSGQILISLSTTPYGLLFQRPLPLPQLDRTNFHTARPGLELKKIGGNNLLLLLLLLFLLFQLVACCRRLLILLLLPPDGRALMSLVCLSRFR